MRSASRQPPLPFCHILNFLAIEMINILALFLADNLGNLKIPVHVHIFIFIFPAPKQQDSHHQKRKYRQKQDRIKNCIHAKHCHGSQKHGL